LKSPDGRIAVEVRADGPLRYDVTVDGKPVVRDASLSLTVDGVALGAAARVKGAQTRTVDSVHEPAVRRKSSSVREHFNSHNERHARGSGAAGSPGPRSARGLFAGSPDCLPYAGDVHRPEQAGL
jgi:hypothetical protein